MNTTTCRCVAHGRGCSALPCCQAAYARAPSLACNVFNAPAPEHFGPVPCLMPQLRLMLTCKQGVLFHDRMEPAEQKKIKPDLKQLIHRFKRKHPDLQPAK